MSDTRWKRILIIAWACLLAFALVYQAEVAEAAHGVCDDQCGTACSESGGCSFGYSTGCGCAWFCNDGSGGRTICT